MQTSNRLFEDLAKVANGAVSTLSGMKSEIEAMIRHRVERIMCDADLVPRDEFEAVKAMAAEARRQNELLEKRLAALEAKLGKAAPKATAKTAGKSTAAKKTAAKHRAAKRAAKSTTKPKGGNA
ncbi:MAG: accessory factor UbiK family protein [Rhodospirillales bacterium]